MKTSTRRLLALAAMVAGPILACSRETAPLDQTVAPYIPPSATATRTALPPTPTSTDTATLMPSATNTPGPTITPLPTVTFPPTVTQRAHATPLPTLYTVQAGDTLRAVAIRFGLMTTDIHARDGSAVPAEGLLSPGTQLLLPGSLTDTSSSDHLIPDSALVYSGTLAKFKPVDYVLSQNGYLAKITGPWAGAELLRQVALNNSVSPRILLALLEYDSGWVRSASPAADTMDYPLRHTDPATKGMVYQLTWAADVLNIGYYGWRDANLLTLTFGDGEILRLAPDLNAGTVALMYYFSITTPNRAAWQQALSDYLVLYEDMFGDPFDQAIEPLYYPDLRQPTMELPFDQKWAFTSGPHGGWDYHGALAALDFAPSDVSDCQVSGEWVTAVAPGLVVRSIGNVVVIDLDGDGLEQTGWNVLYLHIADVGHIAVGTKVETGDRIGHASCQGGVATGTHIHIARKYNGEWIEAAGPIPFEMSGWTAHGGGTDRAGTMTRGDVTAVASTQGIFESLVWK